MIMRKKILITILLSIFFLSQAEAQIGDIKRVFGMTPLTQLPYKGVMGEIDYGLTISVPLAEDGDCSIFRRFVPSNGQYLIGVIDLGIMDYIRKYLITATPEGEFIDCLEVSVLGSTNTGVGELIKQWKIDADMVVTVYQVKPTSTTPIRFEDTSPQTKMNAQRIDTRYQIDETGHIKKIKEIKYQPQDYMILDFTGNRNIWDGKEQPLVP